jgi:disulfide bond formation protein DsbB
MLIGIFALRRLHLVLCLLSLIAGLTSVYWQVIRDKQPCDLCVMSRYGHFAVALFSILAVIYNKSIARRFLLLVLACSLGIGLYHLGAENHWWPAPKGCTTVLPTDEEIASGDMSYLLRNNSPSCDQVSLRVFGVSVTLLDFFLSAILFWLVSIGYAINYGASRRQHP